MMSKALEWSSYFRSSNLNHFFLKHKSHSKRERSHRSVQKQGLMNPDFETDVLKTVVFSC